MATLIEPRQRWFDAISYALSSLALTCAVYYIPYNEYNGRHVLAFVLLFAPLAVLIAYVRFLLQAATRSQRVLAAMVNGTCAVLVTACLWTRPDWPPPVEPPFELLVAGIVVVASIFALALLAFALRHKARYAAGTAAACLIWLCLLQGSLAGRYIGGYRLAHVAGFVAPLVFALAAATLVMSPRFAYCLGLAASVLATPYLVVREMSYSYYGNSWVVFNLPTDRLYGPEFTYAELSILSAILVAISGILSLLRLAPAAWKLRGRSIRSRTWPVFAFSSLIIAGWFAHSVTPYRVPTEYGGGSPEIEIVHFEKRGLRSTETKVSVTRDGRLYTSCDIRNPLRYQSQGERFAGSVPSWEKAQHILGLVRSAQFKTQAGLSRKDLPRRWNSDTWYVYGERVPFVIFSSAKNTAPPKELVDWFNEMNGLPKNESWHFTTKDVCLGFCYEP